MEKLLTTFVKKLLQKTLCFHNIIIPEKTLKIKILRDFKRFFEI